ncbi:hypothetical protein CDL12_16106 [Handroanthus impetiginosus]|uniref:DUF8040 domain-containing protein n=1 Tax=Handroanthus impetiginosus TaxID=429701 RepID=A0A2G9H177_9LAMI|nr:hypothetical protein CDL12_16106 [Handroanthus impetiginosus]
MDRRKRIQILLWIYANMLRTIVCMYLLYCIYLLDHLRVDRNAFFRFCYLLENIGGLQNERFVSVLKKIASFLLILAHHTKNVIVKKRFKRSGQFKAITRISHLLLVQPYLAGDNCCLGTLDETYIEVQVPHNEQVCYRSRKGEIVVNVLGVCNRDMNFIANSYVLRDALNRPDGLLMPTGQTLIIRCPSFYPIKQQNYVILACALLHNFIRTQIFYDPFEDIVSDESDGDEECNCSFIDTIKSSCVWNTCRDELAT